MKVCYIIIGYSGSGKTTLAHSLSDFLKGIGKKTIVIDTDEIRENLNIQNSFRSHKVYRQIDEELNKDYDFACLATCFGNNSLNRIIDNHQDIKFLIVDLETPIRTSFVSSMIPGIKSYVSLARNKADASLVNGSKKFRAIRNDGSFTMITDRNLKLNFRCRKKRTNDTTTQ